MFVANLTLVTYDTNIEAAIETTFNPFIPSIVANHAALGQHVYFVDLHSALGASDLAEGLHPNLSGYDKMANAWYQAITNVAGDVFQVAGSGTNGLNGFPDDWNNSSAWAGGGPLNNGNNYITTTMAGGGPGMLYGISSNFVGAIWAYTVTDGGGPATNIFSGGTLTVSPGTVVGLKQFGDAGPPISRPAPT